MRVLKDTGPKQKKQSTYKISTIQKLTPEQLNTEIKNLEIKIFKEHLWFFCNKKFGVQMPCHF
jgi:hypothetical protein